MIHFVGAGSGDPELLTIKGQRILAQAEAVIYDRLVHPLLLFHCPSNCQFIYVGKTPYQSSMTQSEINSLLVATGQKYQQVVRLKGGDPGIFGRLTEELTAVTAADLAFTIVPGITAASAAGAYNGIPLTERGTAVGVTFMTGHFQKNQKQDFLTLTQAQTIALYMGLEALPDFIATLKTQNFAETTPIAVIRWGTLGRQEKVMGTLKTIVQQVATAGIKNPALILIGRVVENSERFAWFTQQPRFGERLLLVATRPPKLTEIYDYTSQGIDLWWHQVGPERDQRFDTISERYLSEQHFTTIQFLDAEAQAAYEASGLVK